MVLRRLRFLSAALLLAFLAACGGKMVKEGKGQTALLFGHIGMDEAPSGLDWVRLRQMKPKTEEPFWNMRLDEGLFYCENMPVGSYVLDQFGGGGGLKLGSVRFFSNTTYYYDVPVQSGKDFQFRVEKPGLYFTGAFAYKRLASTAERFFGMETKYDIVKAPGPSEAELLERLLEFTEGTGWHGDVRKRLQALGWKPRKKD